MKNYRFPLILLILFNITHAFGAVPNGNTYVSKNIEYINLGMSGVFSGPLQVMGTQVKLGIETYFATVNSSGGIDGKMLRLISLDDHYEPEIAAKNMRDLAENQSILATIGNVGTPTAMVSFPIANEKHLLLFGAYSGAKSLRNSPPDRYVFNFRASIQEELYELINGLLSIGYKPDEFAFFIQNDSFGDSGYFDALGILKRLGYTNPEDLPVGRYQRNTLNIEEGLAEIIENASNVRAFIIIGVFDPAAKFIKLAKQDFPDAYFLNVSTSQDKGLLHELGADQSRIIMTQVVPNLDNHLLAIQEYLSALKKYAPGISPDYGSLEGFLDAKLLVIAIKKAAEQNKLTREGLIECLESIHAVDIGIDIQINYDKNQHQALHKVWPTILKDGNFEYLDWFKLNQEQ